MNALYRTDREVSESPERIGSAIATLAHAQRAARSRYENFGAAPVTGRDLLRFMLDLCDVLKIAPHRVASLNALGTTCGLDELATAQAAFNQLTAALGAGAQVADHGRFDSVGETFVPLAVIADELHDLGCELEPLECLRAAVRRAA